MSHTPTQRRKGGQPGNVNRLRHGLYSQRISLQAENLGAEFAVVDPAFRLALARKRLAEMIRRQESASLRDWLAYERGIARYVSLICSLVGEVSRQRLELQRAAPASKQDRQTLPASSRGQPKVRIPPETGASDLAVLNSFLIRTSAPHSGSSRDLPVGRTIRTSIRSSNTNPDHPQKRSSHDPDK